MQGNCVANQIAPKGECLNGDEKILNGSVMIPLPNPVMSCDSTIKYLYNNGWDPVTLCNTSTQTFKSKCCNACKSMNFFF